MLWLIIEYNAYVVAISPWKKAEHFGPAKEVKTNQVCRGNPVNGNGDRGKIESLV